MVGRWQIVDERLHAELVFDAAGGVAATRWPRSLVCISSGAANLDALVASDEIDVNGRWRSVDTDGGERLLIVIDSPERNVSIAPSVVLMPDDSSVLEITLAPSLDPDDRLTDQTARFEKMS